MGVFRGELTLFRGSAEEVHISYWDNRHATAATTLVLLHGLFDHKGTWSYIYPYLDDHFRLIAIDLLGFGTSSKPLLENHPPAYRYSLAMQVHYLSQALNQLALTHFTVVGSSLGGSLALYAKTSCPELKERIRGLVLISAAGYPQKLPPHVQQLAQWPGALLEHPWIQPWAFRCGVVPWLVRRAIHRAFYQPEKIPPEVISEVLAVLRSHNAFYVYRTVVRNLVPPDSEKIVARYRELACPTLIICGREDRVIPPLVAQRLASDLPHATLHLIEQCGHAPHIEYPDQVAELIKKWQQSVDP